MNDNLLNSIRTNLEESKTQVVERIELLKQQDPFSDPDRLSDNAATDMEATEEDSHDRTAAIIAELELKLTALDDALMRVGNGTYGICALCQKPIEEERLNIMPTATFCLSCEQKKKK